MSLGFPPSKMICKFFLPPLEFELWWQIGFGLRVCRRDRLIGSARPADFGLRFHHLGRLT